jgi:hypothetical protein
LAEVAVVPTSTHVAPMVEVAVEVPHTFYPPLKSFKIFRVQTLEMVSL